MEWQIARDALDAIRAHADRAAPQEACGLLLGPHAEGLQPAETVMIGEARATANVSDRPARNFEIDPQALFRAHREARGGGPRLLGYYHSHPNGCAQPSAIDAARAAPDGKLWIICASGITGWIAGDAGLHGRFRPIKLLET
ncbi:Mov34/MPN/PAD-1 family protein [Pacificimonas sp. ICDLI1SI03]